MTDFVEFLGALRPEVDGTLDEVLPAESAPPTRLHRAMRYSTLAGGKRVRPGLVVLAGETFGALRSTLLPAAAAVELVHTFSLVHDDLPALDNDDLRRGRPTLHRQYDEALAILAGDALLTLGLGCLATRPSDAPEGVRRRATQMLGGAVSEMIRGQVADLEAESIWPEDPAAVLAEIHRQKTGALLSVCVGLGGLYAGCDDEEDAQLQSLGRGLGLMFQIGDDILDVEGNSQILGKTAGKDEQVEKLTYPRVFGVAQSKRMLAELRDDMYEKTEGLPREGRLFRSLIDYLVTRDR